MNIEQTSENKTNQRIDVLFDIKGGAVVPLIISLISGVIVFALAYYGLRLIGIMQPAQWALLLALLVIFLVWMIAVVNWFSFGKAAFLQRVETVIKRDLNNDGVIGVPEQGERHAAPAVITLKMPTVKESGAYAEQHYRLNARPEQLEKLAERCLAGEAFTERNFMKGANAIFYPDEYRALKQQLLGRDLLRLKNVARPQAGYEWTEKGIDLLTRIKTQGLRGEQ